MKIVMLMGVVFFYAVSFAVGWQVGVSSVPVTDVPAKAFVFAQRRYCHNNDGVRAIMVFNTQTLGVVMCNDGATYDVNIKYEEMFPEDI